MDLLDKQRGLYSTEQELEAQKRVVGQVKASLEEARKNLEAFKKEREKYGTIKGRVSIHKP